MGPARTGSLDMNRLASTHHRPSRLAARRGTAFVLLAAGLVAWGCDKPADNSPPPPPPSGSTPPAAPPPGTPQTTSADARILSILHLKNDEEEDLGKLAKDNSESEAVKSYGQMLIDDHKAADDRVTKTAKDANIKLMDDDETKRMLAREKGLPAPPPSAYDELKKLKGVPFDAAFTRHMEARNAELISMVEAARSSVSGPTVKALLDELLPTLQRHRDQAKSLAAAPAPTPPPPR